MELSLRGCRIGVVGSGLRRAAAGGRVRQAVRHGGFDIKADRIAELKKGKDSTLECSTAELRGARKLKYSTSLKDLGKCRVFIVTVPTPIDRYNRPISRRSSARARPSARCSRRATSSSTNPPCIRAAPKKSASRSSSASRDSSSTRISSPATAPSASIRATRNIACRRSRK